MADFKAPVGKLPPGSKFVQDGELCTVAAIKPHSDVVAVHRDNFVTPPRLDVVDASTVVDVVNLAKPDKKG